MAKRILILGGGVGGVVASRRLSSRLKAAGMTVGGDVEIILLSDSEYHQFPPLFFDIAFGNAVPEEAMAPIRSLERLGVKVVVDEATKINLEDRIVMTRENKKIGYDYLVVSLGVRYGWEAYRGLKDEGYHNYTLEGAQKLREAISGFRKGRIVLLVPEIPHRCMMYSHEAATMIAESMRERKADVSVALVTPEKKPLGGLSSEYSKLWLSLYEELGVEYIVHNGLEEVDSSKKIIRAGNVEEKYDFLIKVPPSRLPRVLEVSEGFIYKQDPRWTVVRNPSFRHPSYDEVFLPGEHSMPVAGLPAAGIPVHFASEYVANIIVSELTGAPVPGLSKVMTCVGYYGAKRGFAGSCETSYDGKEKRWRLSCYTVSTSPLVRLLKEAFYKSWVSQLK